jgi:cysteine-rich repeat protein
VRIGVEACDDGNSSNTDDCLNTCVPAACGDGFVRQGLETCDDGNQNSGDGCSSTCQVEGALKPNGQACSAANQCQSTFCVDGVCSNTACTGLCQSPLAAKKGGGADGVCGNIGGGLDPDAECGDQGAASCGTNGFCNGAGACQLYAAGTPCSAASCSNGTLNKADSCNGLGSCVAPTPDMQSCSPFACSTSGTFCNTVCSTNADCAAGFTCNFAFQCVLSAEQ